MSLLRILTALPKGLELAQVAHRAAQGDPEALEYLRSNGLYDIAGIILPGAEAPARKVVDGVGEMLGANHEPYDPKRPPWAGFIKRLLAQESGSYLLMGTMGSGKTQLAIRLASQWQSRGYHVEYCSLYPQDLPDFGTVLHIDTIIKRMRGLSAYLKAQAVHDPDEDDDWDEPKGKPVTPKMPPGHRVVVIDEAGLTLTTSAQDPARRSALQYVAQSRHCDSHVIFIGQTATQIPLPLIGQSVCFMKKPIGDEADTDRDNPVVRNLWEKAAEAFKNLSRSPYYAPPYNNVKSWAYAHAPGLNYRGLVPWSLYTKEDASNSCHEQ